MDMQLYEFIRERKHHAFRKKVDWNLPAEFSEKAFDDARRITERFCRLCREEQAIILPGEQIVFLRTVSNMPEVYEKDELDAMVETRELHRFKKLSNLCPDYYGTIAVGLLEKRKTANKYGKQTIDSLIMLSDKYLEEAKKQGRQDLVEVLAQVPRYPARNFREALQFFRILHFGLWLCDTDHNTVGRFDKHMWPYLKKDMEAGLYDRQSALNLLRDFFLSFNKDNDLYQGVQQGDNGQSMMLGGVDRDGNDVFNLLSELCMEASCENCMIDPKINLRVSSKTPLERFTMASKLTEAGLGFPQYSNDDVVIPALINMGYDKEDAMDYTVAACWEFIIPVVGSDIPNIGSMSYATAVDAALHQNLLQAESYEEFFSYIKQHISTLCDEVIERNIFKRTLYAPFMNVLMDRDVSLGGKYNNFGIHGAGIATAADSLAVIKKYVFEEKTFSKEELIRAVDENFENTPELLHTLRYCAPKMGNNDDYVDSIAVDLMDAFADALRGRTNCRGGIFRPGTGSAMFYLRHVKEMGASPDGRRAGEALGANYAVSLFAKVKGPVSVIASMTKPHLERAMNGGPLTLEFHRSIFSDPDGREKVGALVKSFIDRGGHQLQLNTVDREKLLDAQKHPENYRHLVVRIWGWSAYFVDLDRKYQDHVLARQVYDL